RRSFLWRRLLGCSLLLCRSLVSLRFGFDFFRLHRFHLLRLGYLFGKLGRGELLPIKRNFGNPNRGISLTMAAQLLILLLAFVMEDENLFLAALLDQFAGHQRSGLRLADLAIARRNRKHIAELDVAVGAGALVFHADDIAGRDPVLLSTCADDRVHAYVSYSPGRPVWMVERQSIP